MMQNMQSCCVQENVCIQVVNNVHVLCPKRAIKHFTSVQVLIALLRPLFYIVASEHL